MAQINITELTFGYGGSHDNVFENLNLSIDTNWRLGLIGRNGRGKSTLLRLLDGSLEYKGSISAPCGFESFPYEAGDLSKTVYGIAGEIFPDYMRWQLERELSLMGIPSEAWNRPFSTLSHGERVKSLLCALFIKEHSFLLIDEPTNHLDMEGRAAVSGYLNSKSGFIVVSHDRAFLDGCTDHILALNREGFDLQRGNFSTWLHNKELRDSYELAENEKLKKEVSRLSAAARNAEVWSNRTEKEKHVKNSGLRPDRGYIGHKSAKMMKRAKSIENRKTQAAEEKAGLLKNLEETEELMIKPVEYHANILCEAEKLSIFYGEKTVCENVSFQITRGDRIALRGKNGCGKSSVVKLICGEDIGYTGSFRLGSRLKISHIPQDTSFLKGDMKLYAKNEGIDETLFKAILRKLDFSRAQFEKDLSDLSEGQKKKVLIAKSLCEHANIYIWDEPLNYIDVLSRMQIETLLEKYKPTMLFVEHDRAFIDIIANKVVDL